eukprot:380701_1
MVMDNSNQSIEIDFKTNVHTDNDTWWMRRDCDECDSPVADVTSCGARVPINLFWRCHVMYRSLEMASSPDIGSICVNTVPRASRGIQALKLHEKSNKDE